MVATSSSVKKGIVAMGGSARDTLFGRTSEAVTNYAVTLGTREEQNPYTVELAAIAMALKSMLPSVRYRCITIITRSQSALAAIRQPRQQSGQGIITQIYESANLLKQRGNSINLRWAPAESNFSLGSKAKAVAKRATEEARTQDPRLH